MKKKINFIYFILLVAFTQTIFCQSKQARLDSLHTQFLRDSTKIFRSSKLRPLIALDGRNSFITQNPVNLQGIQFGAVLNDKHSFGMGFYSILSSFQSSSSGEGKNKVSDTIHVGYFTFFYEYTFVDSKRWELGFPVEIGGGGHTTVHVDSSNKINPVTITKGSFIPIGVGFDATYKIFYWLGFNGMVGYRVALTNVKTDPNFNFNGAFYSFGFQVYFGALYSRAKYKLKKRSYKNQVEKINKLQD